LTWSLLNIVLSTKERKPKDILLSQRSTLLKTQETDLGERKQAYSGLTLREMELSLTYILKIS
jgi:hypothetical protein